MDDQGHVYTLDFKYLTNIGENVVVSEEWFSRSNVW